MKIFNYYLLFILPPIILFSCRKDCRESEYSHVYPDQKMKNDFSFFLKKGNWWVYQDQNGVTQDSIVVISDAEDLGDDVNNIKPCIYNHLYSSTIDWYNNNAVTRCDFKIRKLGPDHVELMTIDKSNGTAKNIGWILYFSSSLSGYSTHNDVQTIFNRKDILLNSKSFTDVLNIVFEIYGNGFSSPPTAFNYMYLKEKEGFVGWIEGNDTLSLKNSFVQ